VDAVGTLYYRSRMSDATGTDPRWLGGRRGKRDANASLALLIGWSLAEPWRVGQVAFVSERQPAWVLGRGTGNESKGEARVIFCQQRPGGVGGAEPLAGRGLSRRQLAIRAQGGRLEVERIGRAAIAINGVSTEAGELEPGDVLSIEDELVLYCTERPRAAISERGAPPGFPFGAPDAFGIVGESPRTWLLRDEIAFAAKRRQHVLILGPSGSGKELAARAVHGQSERGNAAFVSRNAATLPAGIIDAELFGNVKNYPNAGMPERDGLVGAADGCLLDELCELDDALTTCCGCRCGQFQRLGDSLQTADLRVISATNRPLRRSARSPARSRCAWRCPGSTRYERCAADRTPRAGLQPRAVGLASRFFGKPPMATAAHRQAAQRALCHRSPSRARAESLLLLSKAEPERYLGSLAVRSADHPADRLDRIERRAVVERIRDALARHRGSVTRAARELGLKNRDVLYRLMKKHGIKLERAG
jgi:two-component system nitrogen regulation response regulator GlnG/two-component system response regulator HydG